MSGQCAVTGGKNVSALFFRDPEHRLFFRHIAKSAADLLRGRLFYKSRVQRYQHDPVFPRNLGVTDPDPEAHLRKTGRLVCLRFMNNIRDAFGDPPEIISRGSGVSSKSQVYKVAAAHDFLSVAVIQRDGRRPDAIRELFQRRGIPQLRIMIKDLRNVFSVIYIGIDRVPDTEGIPAYVHYDPPLQHFEGIPAIYCRFVQSVQRIEIGRTDAHEQKPCHTVDHEGLSNESRFIALSSSCGFRVLMSIIVK